MSDNFPYDLEPSEMWAIRIWGFLVYLVGIALGWELHRILQ